MGETLVPGSVELAFVTADCLEAIRFVDEPLDSEGEAALDLLIGKILFVGFTLAVEFDSEQVGFEAPRRASGAFSPWPTLPRDQL